MSTTPTAPALRIGDVARLVGTTARTIRYYEEIGLLTGTGERPSGRHRLYSDAEVEHLREVMRLRALLGVSLEELKTLIDAEDARRALRAEARAGVEDPARRRELLCAALGHIDRQLALVHRRADELGRLEADLEARRRRLKRKLAESDPPS
ncbi:MAG: MerR family transcriptional regulator [Solirubrobacteraceae bacterium]|jgi:DNA-binding transcriptional MerR regulator